MNNFYKTVFLIIFSATAGNIFAQTYATPELKAQAEKWEAERSEWIKKNPEEYRKQGGDPDTYIKANIKVVENEKTLKSNNSKIVICKKSFLKLLNVIAVFSDDNLSKEVRDTYQADANTEMESYDIFIDWENKLCYTTNKQSKQQNKTDISYLNFSMNNVYTCNDCGSLINVKKIDANTLVFRYQSQDNEKVFYDYTFRN